MTCFSFSPFKTHRLLVFSSPVVKYRFSGDSSGLNLNLTILETSSKPRPRALEESHRALKVIPWSTWIWLRKAGGKKGHSPWNLKKQKKWESRPKNFKTLYHLGYLVLMWVPRGSYFTCQVCCRTWFCAVVRLLDLESGATAQRLTLTLTGGNSSLITMSMSFPVCIQKIKELDQIICHSAQKNYLIPGKKNKQREKKWKRERTQEG